MRARKAQLRRRARQRRQARQLRAAAADHQLDGRVQRVGPQHGARRPAPLRAPGLIERVPGRPDRDPHRAALAELARSALPRDRPAARAPGCAAPAAAARPSRAKRLRSAARPQSPRGNPHPPRGCRRPARGTAGPVRPRSRARASRPRRAPCRGPQLVLADAQREHLTALEADADPACAARHQCAPSPAAGSTISVSTPAVARGCRNATREPRMPIRGCSSISSMPDCFSVASVASMSPTW